MIVANDRWNRSNKDVKVTGCNNLTLGHMIDNVELNPDTLDE